jgi:hypothetical protein
MALRMIYVLVLLAALVTAAQSQDKGTSAFAIQGKLSKKYPKVVYTFYSSMSTVGSHRYFDMKKIVVSDSDGTILTQLSQFKNGFEIIDTIGEFYDEEADMALTFEECTLQGKQQKQDFLFLEDVNFDGSIDIITRFGCGTGGCTYNFFLFDPKQMKYVYSEEFTNEANTIRKIAINPRKRTVEYFSRYHENSNLRRFAVQSGNKLKLIYTKDAYFDSKSRRYLFSEWRLSPDNIPVKREWNERYKEDADQSYLLGAP